MKKTKLLLVFCLFVSQLACTNSTSIVPGSSDCSDARITGGSMGGMAGPPFPATDAITGSGDELFFIGNVYGSTNYGYSYLLDAIPLGFNTYGNLSAGYIAHQNSAGVIDWVKCIGGFDTTAGSASGNVRFTGITYDAGNVYVVGYFDGVATTVPSGGSTSYTSAGGTDFFIAKYNAAGNLLWFKQYGDATDQKGVAITVDNAGGVYAIGTNAGNSIFGLNTGFIHNFIVKFDYNGTPATAYFTGGTLQGSATENATSVAFSNLTNSIYVVGNFSGTIQVWDGHLNAQPYYTATGASDVFVEKFTTSLGLNSTTGFFHFGGTTNTQSLTATKAVCDQYSQNGNLNPTIQIAANYSGTGINLFGNALSGSSGGLITTLDIGSSTAYKNLISLQDWSIPSITKNFALGNQHNSPGPGATVSAMSMINFNGDGTQNWINNSSTIINNNGSMGGYAIAKSINKAFVVGSLQGQATFGSTTIGVANGVRTMPFIWQYHSCL